MKKTKLLPSVAAVAIALFVFGFRNFNESKGKTTEVEKLIAEHNFIIGTQTVGAKYKFTDQSMLVETARAIQDMGSNTLKFSMHPRYCTENYNLPKNDNIKSLKDLATMEPSMKEVLHMDFKYYHIWAYGFSEYTPEPVGEKNDTTQIKFIGGYSDHYAKSLYKELYDFTSYLLNEFKGTGKVFYLGHWEGDWHLRWHYDRTKDVDPKTLEGMIKWEKIRQKAVDDARKNNPASDVLVYNYIEVNLVRKGIEEPGSTTVTNAVVPAVNPDYVSYSSYDATNPYHTEKELKTRLSQSLDYIESFLKPKPGLPAGKRVWIGEYGNPSAKYSDDLQDERSKWIIKAGLEWGTPFILYWEMYNNEINPKSNEQVGYWMINDKGKKQKIYHTHAAFYKESKTYLSKYYQKHKVFPSWDQYRKNALAFASLATSKEQTTLSK